MTHTDNAFIEAYQRVKAANASAAEAEPTKPSVPSGPVATRRAKTHGPHLTWKEQTPLAQAIATRQQRAAAASLPGIAATRLRSFAWPEIVVKLAEMHADDYAGLAPPSTTTKQVLSIAGIHQGSGATTTTLAIARNLANTHGPVMLIDANPQQASLASSLGVLEASTLAAKIANGSNALEAIVHAEDDKTSLVVAGDLTAVDNSQLAAVATQLAARCPTILIDSGSVLDAKASWQNGSIAILAKAFALTGVILVRCESDLSGAVAAAQRIVDSSDALALGVVENCVSTPG